MVKCSQSKRLLKVSSTGHQSRQGFIGWHVFPCVIFVPSFELNGKFALEKSYLYCACTFSFACLIEPLLTYSQYCSRSSVRKLDMNRHRALSRVKTWPISTISRPIRLWKRVSQHGFNMEMLCQKKKSFTPTLHSYFGYIYVSWMVMKRLHILLAVAFASMLTSALHIGFACSQERHVKFNRCAGSSHTNPIYSNKIVGQRLTLENVIFDSIQVSQDRVRTPGKRSYT